VSEFEGLPSGSSTGAAAWEFLVVRAVMLEGVVGGRRGCRVSIKEPLKCEKGDGDRRISRTRKIEKNSRRFGKRGRRILD